MNDEAKALAIELQSLCSEDTDGDPTDCACVYSQGSAMLRRQAKRIARLESALREYVGLDTKHSHLAVAALEEKS